MDPAVRGFRAHGRCGYASLVKFRLHGQLDPLIWVNRGAKDLLIPSYCSQRLSCMAAGLGDCVPAILAF